MTEQWKPIAGLEGMYEVSSLGRVRSLDHLVTFIRQGKPGHRRVRGRIMKPFLSAGYLQVQLRLHGQHYLVHRLVAQAFLENPENKPQVNHIKRPKTNNAVGNLEWATRAEDTIHAMVNGLKPKGSKHPNAQLTEEKVIQIRKLGAQGLPQRDIAVMFHILQPNVSGITTGVQWKHVGGPRSRRQSLHALPALPKAA